MKKRISILVVLAMLLKTISFLLVLAMLPLLDSWFSGPLIDKSIYAAEDWSYIMVYGIKYVKVEEPFDRSMMSTGETWYVNLETTDLQVFDYDATQRYPWIWITDDCYHLHDVMLTNEIKVKLLERKGLYCLPEDKSDIENIFNNISWSKNKLCGEVVLKGYYDMPLPLSLHNSPNRIPLRL